MPTMSTMSCGRQCIPRSSPAWTGWGAWICGTWITTPRWGGSAALGRRGRAGSGAPGEPLTLWEPALPGTPRHPPRRGSKGRRAPSGRGQPGVGRRPRPGARRGGEGEGGQVPLPGAPARPPLPSLLPSLPPSRLLRCLPCGGAAALGTCQGRQGRLRHPRQTASAIKCRGAGSGSRLLPPLLF